MKHFCTVSDIGYINQGLALYQSLVDNMNEEWHLHYCCIDVETQIKLANLKKANLTPYLAGAFEDLKNISGTSRQGYAWELSGRFCKHLLENTIDDPIMYVDSDIIFYPGMEKMYHEIRDKSIGIHLHMHIQPAPNMYGPGYPGGFNNGVTYFNNDQDGRDCLDLWVKAILDPHNKEIITGKAGVQFNIETHNTCGDQRFLEMFPMAFPGETIILGNTYAHGAPWNYHIYDFAEDFSIDNKVMQIEFENRHWLKQLIPGAENRKLPLLYSHFAGFKPDYENDTYAATRERFNEDFLKKPECREIYDEYYQKMKHVKELYNL